jgi:GTP-dependent phosphoenolpyruvate carboxykinase
MIENKQQTAVEFYLDKVFDIIGDAILDKLSIEQINKIHDLSLQAKEMEKEQIEDAYSLSRCEWNKIISSSEYYNETYGGGEQ